MSNKEIVSSHSSHPLVVDLWKTTSKPAFSLKLGESGKRFLELELFRQQVERTRSDPKLFPYTYSKKKVVFYKAIFIGLTALFLILGAFIFSKPMIWPCSVFMLECAFAKTLLCAVCLAGALSTYILNKCLKAEKEFANHLARQFKRKLNKSYRRKKIERRMEYFLDFSANQCCQFKLKQEYQDAHDQIKDKREEVFLLFSKIKQTPYLDPHRQEHLFNQALLEFEEQLTEIALSFENSDV